LALCSPHGKNKVIECSTLMQSTIHVYEVRPRKDKRGVDLVSDALPCGRLWYGEKAFGKSGLTPRQEFCYTRERGQKP
jgi:hypothetical protein